MAPLAISDGQREVLETLDGSRAAACRVVQRARGQLEEDGLVGFGEVAKGTRPETIDQR